MVSKKLLYGLVILFSVIYSSCKPEDPIDPPAPNKGSLKVNFKAQYQGNDLVLDQWYSAGDYSFNAILFKYYIDNFSLINETDTIEIKDVYLADWSIVNNRTSFTIELDPAEYKGVYFGVGLDPEHNQSNPTSFPNDHPLASAQGTHWDMTSEYRFAMFEGYIDTINNGQIEFHDSYVFHTGFQASYFNLGFNENISIKAKGETTLEIILDIEKLLFTGPQPINLKVENVLHTNINDPILAKLKANLAAAISVNVL